jgi:hypothetical protein
MQILITWIAYGLATLLFGACVVAWYEHLGRTQKRIDDDDWEAPPRRAASVDVVLDALPAAATATAVGDVGERRQALGGAMSRMAAGDRRQGQGDTVPMILAGAPADTTDDALPADRRQRARATASD